MREKNPVYRRHWISPHVRIVAQIQYVSCHVRDEQDLILRSRSRLLKNQSWYQDWYWDFQDCSLDINTGIKTFRIAVLQLRLVLKHLKLQFPNWDWYQDFQTSNPWIEILSRLVHQDFENSSPLTKTRIKTLKNPIPVINTEHRIENLCG